MPLMQASRFFLISMVTISVVVTIEVVVTISAVVTVSVVVLTISVMVMIVNCLVSVGDTAATTCILYAQNYVYMALRSEHSIEP